MSDIFYYIIFVLLPVFFLGFQAVLLPVFFFLKARKHASFRAFIVAGSLTGAAFGYVYAIFSGSPLVLSSLSVTLFGAISGGFWFRALNKTERD